MVPKMKTSIIKKPLIGEAEITAKLSTAKVNPQGINGVRIPNKAGEYFFLWLNLKKEIWGIFIPIIGKAK